MATILAVSGSEPERLISREEVVGTMFTLADIAADLAVIRQILEENGEEEEEEEEQEGDR